MKRKLILIMLIQTVYAIGQEKAELDVSWGSIPHELQQYILSLVPAPGDYKQLVTLMQTNKEFQKYVNDQNFLHDFAQKAFKYEPNKAEKLLKEAAKHNNLGLVRAFITTNKSMQEKADDLLIRSAEAGDLKSVQTLLEANADPNVRDEGGAAPLDAAAFNNHPEIIELLIKKGAHVNDASTNGSTALMHSVAHPTIVALLLNMGADVNAQTVEGLTPLLAAILINNSDSAKLLLAKGADSNVRIVSLNNAPALRIAIKHNNKELVNVLLDYGARIDDVDGTGNTALNFASDKGYKDIADLLLDRGAAVNLRNQGGQTPLMFASVGGHKNIVDALINHGAQVNVADNAGVTPLIFAAQKGYNDILKKLLGHNADVNARAAANGYTALMLAAQNGHKDVVESLIAGGADVTLTQNTGQTAATIARAQGFNEIADLIEIV